MVIGSSGVDAGIDAWYTRAVGLLEGPGKLRASGPPRAALRKAFSNLLA